MGNMQGKGSVEERARGGGKGSPWGNKVHDASAETSSPHVIIEPLSRTNGGMLTSRQNK